MVLLWYLLLIVPVMLRLLIGLLCHALYRRQELVCIWRRYKALRRSQRKAITSDGHVCVGFFRRIHFSSTYILGCDDSRLILEGNLILSALGNQIRVPLAGGIKEIEFLAPIALSLRFCTVVAARLVLVAFQVPLSACQAARTRSLRLPFRSGVALPLFGRLVARRVVPGRRRENNSTGHPDGLLRASAGPEWVQLSPSKTA